MVAPSLLDAILVTPKCIVHSSDCDSVAAEFFKVSEGHWHWTLDVKFCSDRLVVIGTEALMCTCYIMYHSRVREQLHTCVAY